jgi:hypothetical protein
MPAGDASRTWFPEMIDMLRREWGDSMSWPEFIQLTARLDFALQAIRSERNIQPPMMWCPKCQVRHRSAPTNVSVRAAILSLGRFEICDLETAKRLEKSWKKYRAENGLGLYGEPEDNAPDAHP